MSLVVINKVIKCVTKNVKIAVFEDRTAPYKKQQKKTYNVELKTTLRLWMYCVFNSEKKNPLKEVRYNQELCT